MTISTVLLVMLTGVVQEQAGVSSAERIDASGPALLAVTSLPTQEGSVNAVVSTPEPQVRQSSSQPQQAKGTGAESAKSTTWSFVHARDSFRTDALLDLRELNEPIAGQNGFIRRSDDRNGFVRGDGVPVRFWGVNYSLAQPRREGARSFRAFPREARSEHNPVWRW